MHTHADLEKVLNRPQAETSDHYNCPQNSVVRDKGLTEICASNVACGMIESSNLECQSSIHSPPTSIMDSKSLILHPPTLNHQPQFSIFNPSYLAKKVLKIA